MAEKANSPGKKPTDWERIESDYRAGVLSVREIATSQGISHTAIQKRAKAEGWERDLKAKVKAKADALVAKREVAIKVASKDGISERQLIEANAEVIANVRMAHRSDIQRGRKLAMSLLDELEQTTENRELFTNLGLMLSSPDEKGADKLNDIYMKVISMPQRVDSMKKLAETLKNLIGMEREAYSIDGADEPKKSFENMGYSEREARIAELLSRQ